MIGEDDCVRLLAAVVMLAAHDARRGNAQAAAWLADFGIDWRTVPVKQRAKAGRRGIMRLRGQ